jgi:putative transcriptional regulator
VEFYQGRALVASPYLTDSNFMRTVVYMIRHDEEGAMGLVLNRPMQSTVGQLLGELTESTIDNNQPVFYGGPVDGPVMILQACFEDQAHEAAEVLIACDQDRILQILDQPPSNSLGYRLFDGYSGWGPGQLEEEINEGSWLIWDIQPEQIFSSADSIWQEAVLQIGRKVIAGGLGHTELCGDPDQN